MNLFFISEMDVKLYFGHTAKNDIIWNVPRVDLLLLLAHMFFAKNAANLLSVKRKFLTRTENTCVTNSNIMDKKFIEKFYCI